MKLRLVSSIIVISFISVHSHGNEKIPSTPEEIKEFCSAKEYEKKIKEIKPKEIQQEIAHKCFVLPSFEKSKPKKW